MKDSRKTDSHWVLVDGGTRHQHGTRTARHNTILVIIMRTSELHYVWNFYGSSAAPPMFMDFKGKSCERRDASCLYCS